MNKNFIDEIKEEIVSSYLEKYKNKDNKFVEFVNNKAEDLAYVFLNRLYETTAFKENYVNLFDLYNKIKLKNKHEDNLNAQKRSDVFKNNMDILTEFNIHQTYEPFLEIHNRKSDSERAYNKRVWTENTRSLLKNLLDDFDLEKPTMKKLYHLREAVLSGIKENTNKKVLKQPNEYNFNNNAIISLTEFYSEHNTKFLHENTRLRCQKIHEMLEGLKFSLLGGKNFEYSGDILRKNNLNYFFSNKEFRQLGLSEFQKEEMITILNEDLNTYEQYQSHCHIYNRDMKKILSEKEFNEFYKILNEQEIDLENPNFIQIKKIVEGLDALKEDVKAIFRFDLNDEEKAIYDVVEQKLMAKYPFLNKLHHAIDKDEVKTDVYSLFHYKTKSMENTAFHLLPVDFQIDFINSADFLLPILSDSQSHHKITDTVNYATNSFDLSKPFIIENELRHEEDNYGIGTRTDVVQICLKDNYGVNVFHISGKLKHTSECIFDEYEDYSDYYDKIDTEYHYKTNTPHHDKDVLGADAFWLPYRNKYYNMNANNKKNRNQVLMELDTSSCHVDFKNMGLSKIAYEKLGQFAHDNLFVLVRDISNLSNEGNNYLKNHFKNLKQQHHDWLLLDIDKSFIADGEVSYSFPVFEESKIQQSIKEGADLNELMKKEFSEKADDWIRINYNNVFYFHLREMILERQLEENKNDVIQLNVSQYNNLRKTYDKGLNAYRLEFMSNMDRWIDEIKKNTQIDNHYFRNVQHKLVDKMENLMEKHERLMCIDINTVSLQMLKIKEINRSLENEGLGRYGLVKYSPVRNR